MRFAIDDAGLVDFATALARTPSVSTGEQAAVELTAARFRALGFPTVEIDGTGNAIGIFGDGGHPRLLIDGHIDTIPLHSEARWSVDPFGGTVRDGRLYGLGICDQKGSIAAAAYGVSAAAGSQDGSFPGTVAVIASVCEEEIEGAALAGFVEQFQPDFAITSEPSDTRLCIGQRGRCKLELRVVGRACHAGHAREGLNAVDALAEMIHQLRRLEHPTHPHLGRRDITCIDLRSAPYPSVSTVPGEAVARFDCRFLPGESPDSLIGTLRGCAEAGLVGWAEAPRLEVSRRAGRLRDLDGTPPQRRRSSRKRGGPTRTRTWSEPPAGPWTAWASSRRRPITPSAPTVRTWRASGVSRPSASAWGWSTWPTRSTSSSPWTRCGPGRRATRPWQPP